MSKLEQALKKSAKNILRVSEFAEQCAVIRYIGFRYPNVRICSSAGGLFTTKTQAIKNVQAGYSAGFPDLFIYEPLGGYHGLAIEVKRIGGRATEEQKEWIAALNDRGYFARFAYGFEQAKELIDGYFRRAKSVS